MALLQAINLAIIIATCKGTPPTAGTSPLHPTGSDGNDWWKYSPIYQIYPRSFQDSNGDGVGDLRGIKQRIPYIRDLGIKAIWLSPIYESPMADFGYDVSNFTNIDPMFGTLDDFRDLVEEVHKHGMYLIMDFVPNHSSDKHDWFQRSMMNEPPYNDYYIWREKPNNWLSRFGNSAWEYVPSRGKYYLHQFLKEQPDLDFHNPQLRQAMDNVLGFWVDRGVDGFRFDAVNFVMEDAEFRDEPRSDMDVPSNDWFYLDHKYTLDLEDNYEVMEHFTKFLHQYGGVQKKRIFTCSEGYSNIHNVMKYYQSGLDFPFNFNLVSWDSSVEASGLRTMIAEWMDHLPAGAWPNWVMGNHDNHRIATRLGGRQYADIANMLLTLLPGTPTFYYGEELGMIDAKVCFADSVDPQGLIWGPEGCEKLSRDPERSPMQWDSTPNGGFSNGKPWLPMGPEWQQHNVKQQEKDPESHLSIFKALIKLRQESVFRMPTNLRLIDVGDENVLAFERKSPEATYLVVLNIGNDGRVSMIRRGLGVGTAEIVIRSSNVDASMPTTVELRKPFKIANAHGYVMKIVK